MTVYSGGYFMNIWRELSDVEVEQFKAWARENHKPGEPVDSFWHPVVRAECELIDQEGDW
jgi:hypothetical protein